MGRHGDYRLSPYKRKNDTTQKTSVNDLNKLRAKIMKAKLTKSKDLPDLERQLAIAMGQGSASGSNVVVLPRVDSHGQLLKAQGSVDEENTNKDGMTIAQMARAERETVGSNVADKDLETQIMHDPRFTNDLEYIDDNIERLSRQKKEKTASQCKQAAIRDYQDMEASLATCDMCFKQSERDDGSTLLKPPEYPVVALGHRVYLALPNREPMNDGHCVIAPIEHVSGSSLKCDDDVWDEISNFMKCLMQMFASKQQGVVFLETVMSTEPARARHCMIECIPMPLSKAEDAPGYFKEGLLSSGDEWSQHRKIIDTTVKKNQLSTSSSENKRDQDDNHTQAREMIRRGGFRNTMTAKMPYFHVWFNPYGGMGHVIEAPQQFPPWFGREVVAGILDLPPTVYRKPRRLKESHDQRLERAEEWKQQFGWDKFDWTKMLQ